MWLENLLVKNILTYEVLLLQQPAVKAERICLWRSLVSCPLLPCGQVKAGVTVTASHCRIDEILVEQILAVNWQLLGVKH